MNALTLTLIWPAALLTGGCIIIPTPEYASHGHATRQNMSRGDEEAIRVGVTTREQVLLRFGEPDAAFDEERRFVYLWARVAGWFFAAAGYSGAAAEIGKGYTLEVDFDARGIVRRREIRTLGMGDMLRPQVIGGVPYVPLQTERPRLREPSTSPARLRQPIKHVEQTAETTEPRPAAVRGGARCQAGAARNYDPPEESTSRAARKTR